MLIKLDKLKEKYDIQSRGVLHIGASSGQEAQMYHDCKINRALWIEAIPDVFEQLKKNIEKFPNSLAINACVSDEDGKEVNFNISSNDGESSSFLEFGIHKEMHPSVEFIDAIPLTTMRMDSLYKKYNINPADYDFLNIDVQGAEMHVLRGMGNLLGNFTYAYIEVNKDEVYKGCGRVEEVDALLAHFGFKGVEERMVDGKWGDRFYIKETEIRNDSKEMKIYNRVSNYIMQGRDKKAVQYLTSIGWDRMKAKGYVNDIRNKKK